MLHYPDKIGYVGIVIPIHSPSFRRHSVVTRGRCGRGSLNKETGDLNIRNGGFWGGYTMLSGNLTWHVGRFHINIFVHVYSH